MAAVCVRGAARGVCGGARGAGGAAGAGALLGRLGPHAADRCRRTAHTRPLLQDA